MHLYRAYGLTIASELPLPELEALPDSAAPRSANVRVHLGEVARLADDDAPAGSRMLAEDTYLVWNLIGHLLVRGGEEIVVEAADGIEPGLVRMMILGRCLGALLLQRGHLTLHASAVRIEGRAVAFCGFSGAGKSTLAASLHAGGWPLLVDDLLPVTARGGRATVTAGFPQIKLEPGEALRFGFADRPLEPLHPDVPERFYPAARGFVDGEVELARVYVIDREPGPSVERLSPKDACVELLRYTFAADLLAAQDARVKHFGACADVASAVAVSRLHTGDDLSQLRRVGDLVLRDLTG